MFPDIYNPEKDHFSGLYFHAGWHKFLLTSFQKHETHPAKSSLKLIHVLQCSYWPSNAVFKSVTGNFESYKYFQINK